MLTSDLVEAAQMLIKFAVQYLGGSWSGNIIRAINSLRCMLTSVNDSIWNFIASTYWLIATFGFEKDIHPYLNEAYQNVCTCQEDSKFIARMLAGFAGDGKAAELMSGCSEGTSNKKIEAKKKRLEFVEKIKEANVKALRAAAQAKRVEEMQTELDVVQKTEGELGLERKTVKAFNQYKQEAQKLEKKTKITEKERQALQKAKDEFNAIKTAKKKIQVKKEREVMTEHLKKDGGLTVITEQVTIAMDTLDKATRKKDEFPDDAQTNMEVEVAEAKVDAIADAADEIVVEKVVGIKEIPKMKELINKSREKRAYNLMWKDAKTLYLKGQKVELTTMMETVEEDFKEKEKEYNEAVKKKALKLAEIRKRFDKSLTTYNASLNIRFDLDELKQKMKNKLDIKIPQKTRTEIKTTIEYLRKNKSQLIKMLKYKYEQYIYYFTLVQKFPDNQDYAKKAALAEDEYNTYKEQIEEDRRKEQEAAEEEEQFGPPDEEFEETSTETITKADGTIVTTITVTTSTGSTTTTTTTQGAVIETKEKVEGTGAVVKEVKTDVNTGKEVSTNGNEKVVTTETKSNIDIKTGTKTETTHTVKDKKIESVNGEVTKVTEDGSKQSAEGQTKDLALPSPKQQVEIIRKEAEKVFAKGQKYITIWIRVEYRILMTLTLRWRQDEDNVDLQLQVNRQRQKLNMIRKALADLRKKADEKDPAEAKKRAEAEKAEKEK
jgi:hypothetical protein